MEQHQNIEYVVKSKKITRQDKEIAVCQISSLGSVYDSSLL
jgi:hypothetical protein